MDSRPTAKTGLTSPRCTLSVADGPLAGRRFVVESELEIGRESPGCRIEDTLVSKRHAVVRVDGDEVVIEDLGSTNGTWVNRHRIDRPLPLHDGDVVRIGATALAVQLSAPPTAVSESSAQHVSQGQTPRPPTNRPQASAARPSAAQTQGLPPRARRSIITVAMIVTVITATTVAVLLLLASGK